MLAIREALEALADAIEEALTNKGSKASKVAENEPAPAPKKSKKPSITMAEVREALIALSKDHGKEAVIDILSRFGVTKIGDLPEEHYAECLKLATDYEPEPEPDVDEEDPLGEDEPEDTEDEPGNDPEPPKKRRRRS